MLPWLQLYIYITKSIKFENKSYTMIVHNSKGGKFILDVGLVDEYFTFVYTHKARNLDNTSSSESFSYEY
jgi:hypothetical protein